MGGSCLASCVEEGVGEVNHPFVYIWKGGAGVGGSYCLVFCGEKSVGWGYAVHPAQRASRGALEADHF